MRARIGTALVVVALALGGALVAAAPAGAAGPHTVTVTPRTGLADGQTVSVHGTGFTETPIINDWVVSQCSSAVLAAPNDLLTVLDSCNVDANVIVHADPVGNITATLVVAKSFNVITPERPPITCGQAPDDCAVLIAQVTDPGVFTGAATPISFGSPPRTLHDCIRDAWRGHTDGQRHRLRSFVQCVLVVLAQHGRH